jgi:class 3 adenylate cyclase
MAEIITTTRPVRLVVPITDLEAQRVLQIPRLAIHENLRMAHLVAETIVASPSFLIESRTTEHFYRTHKELVKQRDLVISMKEAVVEECVERKQREYNNSTLKERYPGYFNPERPLSLLRLAIPLARHGEMKSLLLERLRKSILSAHPFSLASELRSLIEGKGAEQLLAGLTALPDQVGELPFTWEVLDTLISPTLSSLPDASVRSAKRVLRQRLLSWYCDSLASLSQSVVQGFGDWNLSRLDAEMNRVTRLSLLTFGSALRLLNVKEVILRMSDWELFAVKQSSQFRSFIECYCTIVHTCETHATALQSFLEELEREQRVLSSEGIAELEIANNKRSRGLLKCFPRPSARHNIDTALKSDQASFAIAQLEGTPLVAFRDMILERFVRNEADFVRLARERILRPLRASRRRHTSAASPFIRYGHKKPAGQEWDFEAFVVSAKRETATKSFQDWAGNERVTLAIVFTDVVGCTALGEEIKDEAMNEVRRAHFAQSRKMIDQFKGREIKTIGDSFMAAFRDVNAALDYALALQKNTGHPQVQIRAGIHIGAMQVEEGDVFGGTVNFAARVVGAIKGAEIWVSERAKADIDQLGAAQHKNLRWERHEGVAMKGFPGTFTLWSLKP